MPRLLDEITEDTPGVCLALCRAHPLVRWASFREYFAPLSLIDSQWSQLRIEQKRIVVISAPTGRKRIEIEWTPQHQFSCSIGDEFGGPLSMQLSISLADTLIARFSLRVQHVDLREEGRDLAFRCAALLGLSSFETTQDNAQALLLSFRAAPSTEEVAYRQSSSVSLPVPQIQRRNKYHEQSPRRQQSSLPHRAFDDSYLILSWSPALIHFCSSRVVDWDAPRERWSASALCEVQIDFTNRRILHQKNKEKLELPFATARDLFVSRWRRDNLFYSSLGLSYSDHHVTLVESDGHGSPQEALDVLFMLSASLSEALGIPCCADLFVEGGGASLCAVIRHPTLIFAGSDGEHSIAYIDNNNGQIKRLLSEHSAFNSISPGESTWMVGDGGCIFEYRDRQWTPHHVPGRTRLNAVVQNQKGGALAVGENGRVLRRSGADWFGVLREEQPPEMQRAELVGAASHEGTGFLVAAASGELFISEGLGDRWRKIASFYEEVCAFGKAGDRYWLTTRDGKLFLAQQDLSFQQASIPTTIGPIRSVAIGSTMYAVGEGGVYHWPHRAGSDLGFIPARASNISIACARLTRPMTQMHRLGHWESVSLYWRKIRQMPIVNWAGVSSGSGGIYVVGGSYLVRLRA